MQCMWGGEDAGVGDHLCNKIAKMTKLGASSKFKGAVSIF